MLIINNWKFIVQVGTKYVINIILNIWNVLNLTEQHSFRIALGINLLIPNRLFQCLIICQPCNYVIAQYHLGSKGTVLGKI